jgi:hypothetical protein
MSAIYPLKSISCYREQRRSRCCASPWNGERRLIRIGLYGLYLQRTSKRIAVRFLMSLGTHEIVRGMNCCITNLRCADSLKNRPASLRRVMRQRGDKMREENLETTRGMPPQMYQAAITFFREDIERTEDLIHRDLSAWLNA